VSLGNAAFAARSVEVNPIVSAIMASAAHRVTALSDRPQLLNISVTRFGTASQIPSDKPKLAKSYCDATYCAFPHFLGGLHVQTSQHLPYSLALLLVSYAREGGFVASMQHMVNGGGE
jgi:hypothetical protein